MMEEMFQHMLLLIVAQVVEVHQQQVLRVTQALVMVEQELIHIHLGQVQLLQA
jgi:hypothetical protein